MQLWPTGAHGEMDLATLTFHLELSWQTKRVTTWLEGTWVITSGIWGRQDMAGTILNMRQILRSNFFICSIYVADKIATLTYTLGANFVVIKTILQSCIQFTSPKNSQFYHLKRFDCNDWRRRLRLLRRTAILLSQAEKSPDLPQLKRVFTYGLVYCQIKQVKSAAKLAIPCFLVTETYSIVFLQQRLLSVSVDVRWGKSRIESGRLKWTRFWVTKIGHQMALLSALLKGAKTINRWCPSHHQIRIAWLFCSIWSIFDDWMMMKKKKDDL